MSNFNEKIIIASAPFYGNSQDSMQAADAMNKANKAMAKAIKQEVVATGIAKVMENLAKRNADPRLKDFPNRVPTRFILKDDLADFALGHGLQGILYAENDKHTCALHKITCGQYAGCRYEKTATRNLDLSKDSFFEGTAIIALPVSAKKILEIGRAIYGKNWKWHEILNAMQTTTMPYADACLAKKGGKINLKIDYTEIRFNETPQDNAENKQTSNQESSNQKTEIANMRMTPPPLAFLLYEK